MDEFKKRFNAAKAHRKDYIEEAGREVYRFCFNGREREWDDTPGRDALPEEIFTDFPATIAEEFHGELFSTMTPENAPWVEYEAANDVGDNGVPALDELTQLEQIISKSIRGSNYYTEGQAAFQDAVVGTVGAWIERPDLSMPIQFRAVPCSKMFLRIGPRGLEDRFFRERYYYSDLPSLLPNAKFNRETQDKIKKSAGQAIVIWGFWRDYSDSSNPQWVSAVRVDNKEVGLDKTIGPEGSCPLVIGRFNAIPGSAWGRGPGIRMLPTLRVLDEITRMNLEGMDKNLDPAFVYPHDGMLDLSNGIENGLGYPAMPGTGDQIRPLGLFGNLDYGFFSEERLQEAIRTGFYREALQRGKTPPSASQYMSEENKQTRRMARPAAPLWAEFGIGILKRVEFIERENGGALQGSKLPMIDGGEVITRPISPLERAQAREDVQVGQTIMALANEGLGPQQAAVLIDGPKTFRNIKAKLKDRLVEFRTEQQVKELMMQAQQAAQGQMNGNATPQG